jgi:hypothetical protein
MPQRISACRGDREVQQLITSLHLTACRWRSKTSAISTSVIDASSARAACELMAPLTELATDLFVVAAAI